MMFSPLSVDPQFHEILPEDDFIKTLRQNLHRPDLFLYRHKGTHNFVLSSWQDPSNSVFVELFALVDHPNRLRIDPDCEVGLNKKGWPGLKGLPPLDVIALQFLAPADKMKKEVAKQISDFYAWEAEEEAAAKAELADAAKSAARKLGPVRGDHPEIERMKRGEI